MYEHISYTVIDLQGTRYTLLASDPKHRKRPIFRHASQVKLYQEPVPSIPTLPTWRQRPNPIHFRDVALPSQQRRWSEGNECEPTDEIAAADNDSIPGNDIENNRPDLTTLTIQEYTEKIKWTSKRNGTIIFRILAEISM